MIKIYGLPEYHEPAGGYMSAASLCGNQEVVGTHLLAVMTIYGVVLVTCNFVLAWRLVSYKASLV
jgi:nitrogen fixation protein FixH